MPYRAYALAILVAGIGAAIVTKAALEITGLLAFDFVLLILLSSLFELYPVSLPSGRHLSLGSAFSLAGLILLGPSHYVVIEGIAGLLGIPHGEKRWKWLFISLSNVGQYVIAAYLTARVYVVVGGRPGALDWAIPLRLAVSSAVYIVSNVGLVSSLDWATNGRAPLHTAKALLEDGGPGFLVTAGFGLAMAYAWKAGGWPQVALLCFAILAFRHAVQLYLEMKRRWLNAIAQAQVLGAHGHAKLAQSHSHMVADLSRELATRLGLPQDEIDLVHVAALVHDVGEVEVAPRVVAAYYRGAVLTLNDAQEYQRHAVVGGEMAARLSGVDRVGVMVRHHHEHWDGTGYPDRLAGQAIPLGARILAAAEAATMIAIREPHLSRQELIQKVAALSGTVLDPAITPKLIEILGSDDPILAEPGSAVPTGTDISKQLLEAVGEPTLLELLDVGHILHYKGGHFYLTTGEPASPIHGLPELVELSLRQGQPVRQQLADASRQRIYEVFCVPLAETAIVLMLDITNLLSAEREQRRRLQQAYKDVLFAVTRGKLRFLDETDLRALLTEGEVFASLAFQHPRQVRECRQAAIDLAAQHALADRSFPLALCVSEAVTNVLKHAGRGQFEARVIHDGIRIVVTDSGAGIPLDILPNAILVDGFSTKESLGKGFNLMLHYMDRVWIYTSPEGTTVVLDVVRQRKTETGDKYDAEAVHEPEGG